MIMPQSGLVEQATSGQLCERFPMCVRIADAFGDYYNELDVN